MAVFRCMPCDVYIKAVWRAWCGRKDWWDRTATCVVMDHGVTASHIARSGVGLSRFFEDATQASTGLLLPEVHYRENTCFSRNSLILRRCGVSPLDGSRSSVEMASIPEETQSLVNGPVRAFRWFSMSTKCSQKRVAERSLDPVLQAVVCGVEGGTGHLEPTFPDEAATHGSASIR